MQGKQRPLGKMPDQRSEAGKGQGEPRTAWARKQEYSSPNGSRSQGTTCQTRVNLSIKKNNESSYDTLDRNKSKSTVILNNKCMYGGVALHRIPGNAYTRKDQRRKITLQCNHGHRQGPSVGAKTMLKSCWMSLLCSPLTNTVGERPLHQGRLLVTTENSQRWDSWPYNATRPLGQDSRLWGALDTADVFLDSMHTEDFWQTV